MIDLSEIIDKESYLGDGVYVRFDGYQIWLRTPRENGDHEIALEPGVYLSLTNFMNRLAEQIKARVKA